MLITELVDRPVVGKADDRAASVDAAVAEDCADDSLPEFDGGVVCPELVLLEFVAVLPEFDAA